MFVVSIQHFNSFNLKITFEELYTNSTITHGYRCDKITSPVGIELSLSIVANQDEIAPCKVSQYADRCTNCQYTELFRKYSHEGL